MILHFSTSERGLLVFESFSRTVKAIKGKCIKNSNAFVNSLLCEKQNARFIKVIIFTEELIIHKAKCSERKKVNKKHGGWAKCIKSGRGRPVLTGVIFSKEMTLTLRPRAKSQLGGGKKEERFRHRETQDRD